MKQTSLSDNVRILAYEHPDWVPILKACVVVAKRSKTSCIAGSWVHAELRDQGISYLPNNLRLLVRVGILQKSGDSTHSGHRAYYLLPDIAEIEKALEGLGDCLAEHKDDQQPVAVDNPVIQSRITQIESSDEFVRLCTALLNAEYDDFMSPDDSAGDRGNDGYSENAETIFQIYCPEKPERMGSAEYVSRIRTKIHNDLAKAKKLSTSGDYRIKKWIFITPRELRESEQTYLRIEAEKQGFEGIAWASIKLAGLLAEHDYLRSQFPTLILPNIEAQVEAARSDIGRLGNRLDDVDEVRKLFLSKLEQNYKRRIDEAKIPLDEGNWEVSKTKYEPILRDIEEVTDPIDPHLRFRVYNNLGVSELNLNNHKQAAELFEKAYSMEPELPMAAGKFALSKLLKGKPEEGLSIIDSALEKNPNDDDLVTVKANILYGLRKYDELIPFLRSKGKVTLTHWYEGFDRMDRKDYEGALASFEAVLRIEPKNCRAMILVAQNIMVGMQNVVRNNPFPADRVPPEIKTKFLRAIECLKGAIEILKRSGQKADLEMAYTNLAGCYVAISANSEAIEAADEAIALDSNSAISFLNKGVAQLKRGFFRDAIESFNTYKQLGGIDIDIDRHIAFCSIRVGKLDEAERIITERLENNQQLDLDVAELAVDLYLRKLDNDKLMPLLGRLEKEFPENPQAIRIRSSYLQRCGLEGAEALIRRALANSKTASEKIIAENDLADFYYDQKDYERAAEIYKKYTNIEESSQATLRYVECLYLSGHYGLLLEWVKTLSPKAREGSYISQTEAYVNFYLGNLEEASRIFKSLYEKSQNGTQYLQYLVFYGMCQLRLGHEDVTKNAYDTAKNRVTSTQDLVMLAEAYGRIGEWKTAVELTFKALENDPHNPKAHLAYIFTFLRCEQAEGDQGFEEKHIKKFQKSIGEFNKRFPDETALRGFEVKDNDFSEMLKIVDRMVETTENATNLYKDSKAPMAFVPMITGKRPFDIWAAFTNMPDVGIKMSFGAPDELPMEMSAIESAAGSSIAIDIYPLFILGHLDQLDLLTRYFKNVYVHQDLIDELGETIEERRILSRKGITTIGKAGGKHRIDVIPSDHIKQALDLLERIWTFLTKNERVKIRGLSKERPEEKRDIINALHKSTSNGVLLSQEMGIPFYCDDRVLRAVLRREQNIRSFSTQGFLLAAQKSALITSGERFEHQERLIDLNYSYISINAAFILTRLKKTSYRTEHLGKIISVLVQKETSIQSLSTVLADLFFAMVLDNSVDISPKLQAFAYILRTAMPNHDLKALEEGIFIDLQRRISSEQHGKLRDMIRTTFQNAKEVN